MLPTQYLQRMNAFAATTGDKSTGSSQNWKYMMYCIVVSGRQLTCTENFVKFGHVAFEICEQTDIHEDTNIAVLSTPRVK